MSTPDQYHLTGATIGHAAEGNTCHFLNKNFPSATSSWPPGAVADTHRVPYPQSENLFYRDFKTLLKAGKVIDLLLWEAGVHHHRAPHHRRPGGTPATSENQGIPQLLEAAHTRVHETLTAQRALLESVGKAHGA
jgi:hypothetical protein